MERKRGIKRFLWCVGAFILLLLNLVGADEKLNLKIDLDKEFNIISVGEKVNMEVGLSGLKEELTSQEGILNIKVFNFYQECIKEEKIKVSLTNGKILRKELKFDKPSFYRIHLSLQIKDKMLDESIPVGVLTDYPFIPGDSFGINFGRGDLLKISGIKWIRINIFWRDVESEKGKFQFEGIDKTVDELIEAGIKIMAVLSGPPKWAQKVPADYRPITSGVHKGWGDFPPKDMDAWGNYVYQVVKHFKGRISHFEIWNEPWPDTLFFRGGTTEDYVQILKSAYIHSKSANPDCKIVGLGGTDYKQAERVFAAGGFPYMDIASIHIYQPGIPPEKGWFKSQIEEANKVLEKYRGKYASDQVQEKELWITESGWPTHTGLCEGWLGIPEEEQAKYLVRAQVLAISYNVKKFFWFSFQNAGEDITNFEHNQGILYHNLTPKPSFISYAVLIRMIGDKEFKEELHIGPQCYTYLFEKEGKGCFIIWTTSRRVKVQIKALPPNTQIFDIMGSEVNINNLKANYFNLPISDSPLYILGEGKDILKIKEILTNAEVKFKSEVRS